MYHSIHYTQLPTFPLVKLIPWNFSHEVCMKLTSDDLELPGWIGIGLNLSTEFQPTSLLPYLVQGWAHQ